MKLYEIRKLFGLEPKEVGYGGICRCTAIVYFEETREMKEVRCQDVNTHRAGHTHKVNDDLTLYWDSFCVNFLFVPKPILCVKCGNKTHYYTPDRKVCEKCERSGCMLQSEEYQYMNCGREKNHEGVHYDYQYRRGWLTPDEVKEKYPVVIVDE